jgi:hypothetical protein
MPDEVFDTTRDEYSGLVGVAPPSFSGEHPVREKIAVGVDKVKRMASPFDRRALLKLWAAGSCFISSAQFVISPPVGC